MIESVFVLPNQKNRKFYNRAFGFFTRISIVLSLLFLVFLLSDTFIKSIQALYRYEITVTVPFDKQKLGLSDKPSTEEIKLASYSPLWREAVQKNAFPTQNSEQLRSVFRLISQDSGFILRDMMLKDQDLSDRNLSVTLPLSSRADFFMKRFEKEAELFKVRTSALSDANSSKNKRVFILNAAPDRVAYLNKLAKKENFTDHDSSLILFTEKQAYKILNIRSAHNGKAENFAVSVKPLSKKSELDDVTDQQKEAMFLEIKTPEYIRTLNDFSVINLLKFQQNGSVHAAFNKSFFLNGDSREAELAGIFGAVVGSFLLVTICFALALPIGVAAAVYLQEFSKRNLLTGFLEVNINNLAAVPSIIYGLLGLAIFINLFGMPRSSPLAGGAVLALMSLPVVIIATRAALRSVPQSLRDGAAALGATKLQVFFHHTLPCAIPGIMTGTVLAISRALGETAPLLLIGMVAFIPDTPKSFIDEATALPVQIFLWSDNPDPSYAAKTSAAVLALLVLMITFNAGAIYLRKKFTIRY